MMTCRRSCVLLGLALLVAYTAGPAQAELIADFSSDVVSGQSPLIVRFTDLSQSDGDPIVEWEWNFGEGNSSVSQHAVTVYTLPGIHTVTLTVRTVSEQATKTIIDYVEVGAPSNFANWWTWVGPHRNWQSITSSADGMRLAAVAAPGQIFTSRNRGLTWSARETYRSWKDIASTATGQTLVAAESGGGIYRSTDYGATWDYVTTIGVARAIACSADGSVMAACSDQIYLSVDGGDTWNPVETTRSWSDVAVAADGSTVGACVSGGQIYVSGDSGTTWSVRETSRQWSSISLSEDGSVVVACVSGGDIHKSANSGVTWTSVHGTRGWTAIACSADGMTLAATESLIHTSTDGGATWQEWGDERTHRGITCSADGQFLAACPAGDAINVYPPLSLPELKTWQCIASSADGLSMVAGTWEDKVYTTSDRGITWTERDTPNQKWHSVTSSYDGQSLAAGYGRDQEPGRIYTSTDGGATWAVRTLEVWWPRLASSSDGAKLVAVERFGGGGLYLSDDHGATWTTAAWNTYWWDVASSADGQTLVACDLDDLYTSIDRGATWTTRNVAGGLQDVVCTGDGTKMAACKAGEIFVSFDSGATWTTIANPNQGNMQWHNMAVAGSGNLLAVVGFGGFPHYTQDWGASWTTVDTERFWTDVVVSADGGYGAATEVAGKIHVEPPHQQAQFDSEIVVGGAKSLDESTVVEFTDLSTSDPYPIIEWEWDFGDGTISTEEDPVHEYAEPGSYAVGLRVSTGVGEDMELKFDLLEVGGGSAGLPVGGTVALGALLAALAGCGALARRKK